MKKFLYILYLLFIYIIFDFLITFFLISKFNFYEKFNPSTEHRVANEFFHHSFKENVNTYDYWGNLKYKFITNSIGFKDKINRNIKKNSEFKKRIIINGDSFTEGIGFNYERTFVGLLDEKLKEENIEILNAGVASQSPILYYKKIKHLIKFSKINFDELIIFLDISDIPDEFYYNKSYKNSNNNQFNLRDYLQKLLLKNFSTYLLFDRIFTLIDGFKRYFSFRINAANEFNLNFFNIRSEYINYYKAFNVKRGKWTHNDLLWNKHGKKGRDLAKLHLNQLSQLCENNNIKLTLIIYPWPSQIFYDLKSIRHREFWKNWSQNNNITFIDLYQYFENEDPLGIINKFFIPGDVHWNEYGHKYIYDIIMKEYFKNNSKNLNN